MTDTPESEGKMEHAMSGNAPKCKHGRTSAHRYSIPVFYPGDDSEAWCSGPPNNRRVSDTELDAPFIPNEQPR